MEMVSGDFNHAAVVKEKSDGPQRRSTIEEPFVNTNLPFIPTAPRRCGVQETQEKGRRMSIHQAAEFWFTSSSFIVVFHFFIFVSSSEFRQLTKNFHSRDTAFVLRTLHSSMFPMCGT